MDRYTKEQLLGYVILAAKALNYTKEQISELIYKTEEQLNNWTEETAEQTFERFFKLPV